MSRVEESIDWRAEVLDWNALLHRCMGRTDLADRVVAQYRQNLEASSDAIRRAVESADTDEIARLAHRLKGTSLTVSASAVADAAACLEASAQAGAMAEVALALEALRIARDRFVEAVSSTPTEDEKCRM